MMCPRCEYPRMKYGKDLTGEEKFLAERLPLSSLYTVKEREKHLFCPRCWNEVVDDAPKII